MWKKTLAVAALLVGAAATLAWIYRIELLLLATSMMARDPIAENRPVIWETGPGQAIDRPNIIVILMDDMGINDVSTFGGGMIDTPNIDRLAAEGALFVNAYAGHANCAPSRAALLTGRGAARTGFDVTPIPANFGRISIMVDNALDNGRPQADYFPEIDRANPHFNDRGLPGTEITLAEIMKEAGYRTLHIGKWHLGRSDEMNPNAQGFDESLMAAYRRIRPRLGRHARGTPAKSH